MPSMKLFGNLRQIAGVSKIETQGATVRQAIETLCANDTTLRDAILIDDHLRPYVRVMIDGQDVELVQGLDTPVMAHDQIAIFPPIAGGSRET